MKRKISVLLVIALIATLAASYVTVGAADPVQPVAISTTKTTFAQGEDIVVTFSGLSSDILAGSSDDVELRLDWGWDLDGYNNPNSIPGSYGFADMGSTECYTKAPLTVSENGTKTLPANDARVNGNTGKKYIDGVGYPTGKYTLWVMDYSPARKIVSNRIEIEIVNPNEVKPSLALSKTTFTVGEDIVASYENFTEMYYGNSFTEIDIFAADHVVGKDSSKAGFLVDSATVSGIPASGTISFPDDDTDRKGKNFPLPAGEYYMCLRADNTIIGEKQFFTIVAAPATSAPATSAPATSAPATSTPTGMTISVDKLTFTEGESIVVSYDGYDVAGDHDVEIRLVKGHNMSHSDMLAVAYRHDYTDVSDNYSANTKQDTTVAITASGKRAFPDDGYGNVAVVPGVYSIAAYDYNDGAKQISNLIEITVVAAGASQSPSAAPSATPGATNQPTGDSSMFMVVALVALCAGACVVFFKKRCSE